MKRMVPILVLALASFATAGDVHIPGNNPTSQCSVIPMNGAWPSSNWNAEWRYQTLLRPGWIGRSGVITDIAFVGCNSNGTLNATNFQISMSHTTLTSISSTFALNLPNPQVVLPAGAFAFTTTARQWTNIQLANPFFYNGTDSLTIEIIYAGGTANRSMTCETDPNDPKAPFRAYQYGTGAPTALTARTTDRHGLKIRLTFDGARVVELTAPKIGTAFTMQLQSPLDPGKVYQMGTSLGLGPTALGHRKSIGLTVDPLLVASVGNTLPGVFVNYAGVLSASGRATAQIVLPSFGALVGVTVYNAFLVIDLAQPGGIGSVSTTLPVTLRR